MKSARLFLAAILAAAFSLFATVAQAAYTATYKFSTTDIGLMHLKPNVIADTIISVAPSCSGADTFAVTYSGGSARDGNYLSRFGTYDSATFALTTVLETGGVIGSWTIVDFGPVKCAHGVPFVFIYLTSTADPTKTAQGTFRVNTATKTAVPVGVGVIAGENIAADLYGNLSWQNGQTNRYTSFGERSVDSVVTPKPAAGLTEAPVPCSGQVAMNTGHQAWWWAKGMTAPIPAGEELIGATLSHFSCAGGQILAVRTDDATGHQDLVRVLPTGIDVAYPISEGETVLLTLGGNYYGDVVTVVPGSGLRITLGMANQNRQTFTFDVTGATAVGGFTPSLGGQSLWFIRTDGIGIDRVDTVYELRQNP